MTQQLELVAITAFGLEAVVARELRDLGYPETTVEDGRVRFKGDAAAICRTNLWLRCAERVQVVVGEFDAVDFDQLFDQTKELPWEEWLPVDAIFPVGARSVRSVINSPRNVQRMVKRSIVERLKTVYNRHRFAEDGVEYPIEVSILRDKVLMTIDATGDGLHKRGYRQLVGPAPLRETVAAALLKLSYWNRNRLLVDPFCGSGTIAIEAALLGRNLAPGRDRSFVAENWNQIDLKHWKDARQEARDLVEPPLPIRIVARDRDRKMISIAKRNANEAGIFSEIFFEAKDFISFPTDRDFGCTVANPPYGERLGEKNEVRQLHHDMGELLIPLEDWSHYIFTGADNFEREFGKRADRRRKIFSGRIPCTYYQYLGPRPPQEANETDSENVDTSVNTEDDYSTPGEF
ncbi:Ribosomal RNA large subunit methyltransferase K/L [Thalassoglobus neptunius]|uniref:Ribosomal RNA large subunit methyltransferase K/L n=1 Tax=Thalassoglobus neptunius TaxID=1938619 RepID=A0A5C5X4I6_9PLAN|nr:class I SAM-dependent RNA methyltransferase [Thalassoglobus neptunius]TWT57143.1 Ribosomal RNA large subunit methyltransferase K/L [Thalassoglobus neptunius]